MNATWSPDPLARIDTEQFRRELVGDNPKLAARSATHDPSVKLSIRNESVQFVGVLAELMGQSNPDDRVKMWEWCGKALATAGVGIDPDDFATFACNCLASVQCDPVTAACYEPFQNIIEAVTAKGAEYREAVISYLSGPTMAIAIGFAKKNRNEAKPFKGKSPDA
jgi:hypothetical protein